MNFPKEMFFLPSFSRSNRNTGRTLGELEIMSRVCLIAGCVSVLPYDEDYVLTFPNGYGR